MLRILPIALAGSVFALTILSPAAHADVLASKHVAGYCVDIKDGGHAILWNCHGGVNQNFQYSGYGPIKYDGKCLDTASSAPSREGDALVMKVCSGKSSQKWGISGTKFSNEEGYCADIKGGARERGTPIIAWKCGHQSNQQWALGRVVPLSQASGIGLTPAAIGKLNQADAQTNAKGGNIVAAGGGNIVAAGGGNVVAGGAGNIVAAGGGNIVAAGGGNLLILK